MSTSKYSRRDMLEMSAKATAAAAFASQMPFAFAAGKEDIYGGYSGNKDYKFIKTPATVYDFGLTPEQELQAAEIHKKSIVFDALMECTFYPELIQNAKIGGLTSGNFSIGITDMFGWRPDNMFDPDEWWTWEAVTKDLARIPGLMRTFSDDAMATYNAADIIEAKMQGKVGFMPGTQNLQFMGRDTRRIKEAYDMGLRIIQLTYNPTNMIGSGSMEKVDSRFGLSTLGERAVGEMNQLGMLVDTGHCSPNTMIKAAQVSEKPIAISHAGMISKVDQFRATTDEALRVVADRGGVVGVISTPGAIAGSDRCTVEDYIDNIEHAINIAGIDHVGIGSDFIIPGSFEQILTAPSWDPEVAASIGSFEVWPWSDGHVGWENNAAYPNMTRGLLKRGYKEDEIAKVLGGNFLRLIKDTIG
ncbi:dipeptidase [Vibrio coralliirubri]|uniref:dipeptidase n=1 Tax=Vibrio coralliirubri TaxID=1516159 RepID=UPI002FE14734